MPSATSFRILPPLADQLRAKPCMEPSLNGLMSDLLISTADETLRQTPESDMCSETSTWGQVMKVDCANLECSEPLVTPRQRYRRVHVRLIVWEEQDLNSLERELRKVHEAFSGYHYSVEVYRIPTRDATISLRRKIRQCNPTPKVPRLDTLVILYYYGHGGFSEKEKVEEKNGVVHKKKSTEFILSGRRSGGVAISWKRIYRPILQLKCDTLVILDCCHAGASVLSGKELGKVSAIDRSFAKEILYSSGFESVSVSGLKHSFASMLADNLNDHLSSGLLDTPSLARDVAALAKQHYRERTKLVWGEVTVCEKTGRTVRKGIETRSYDTSNPGLFQLVPGRRGPIILQPLKIGASVRKKRRNTLMSGDGSESIETEEGPRRARRRLC
ncbi:hypothetical protein C8034_v007762 [Colletotrichum sidae]|uniref:Peptidase C14 caspase domain-containing protein n=1 Tax=Colletotrichum sidae TaxID=1347389 RepID=A0A4R8TRS9_9PEZI|nr:hypothetical protein C8034_v007762 [Colletotrichum sidae]